MVSPLKQRSAMLFLVLGGFFIANAIIAEFIGVKIFSLEQTFGYQPFNWHLLGINGSLQFTAGVLLWPIVFTMSDIINEYFGHRGVRILSILAAPILPLLFLFRHLL